MLHKSNEWTDQEHDAAMVQVIEQIRGYLVLLETKPSDIAAIAFEVIVEDGRLIGGETEEENVVGLEAGEAQALYDLLASAAEDVEMGLLVPETEEKI